MKRYLEEFIREDLKEKVVLLSGPRQVGKTTLSRQLTASHFYLNYDASSDRRIIHAQEWDRDAELVIFENCGHFSYQDKTEEFAAMILTWVGGGYQAI